MSKNQREFDLSTAAVAFAYDPELLDKENKMVAYTAKMTPEKGLLAIENAFAGGDMEKELPSKYMATEKVASKSAQEKPKEDQIDTKAPIFSMNSAKVADSQNKGPLTREQYQAQFENVSKKGIDR